MELKGSRSATDSDHLEPGLDKLTVLREIAVQASPASGAEEHPALLCKPWARDRVLDLSMVQDRERRELRRAWLQRWIRRSGWCGVGFAAGTIGTLMLCNLSMMAAPPDKPPAALVMGLVSVAERVLFPTGMVAIVISGLVLARLMRIAREECLDLDTPDLGSELRTSAAGKIGPMNQQQTTSIESQKREGPSLAASLPPDTQAGSESEARHAIVSRPWERDRVLNLRMAADQEQRAQRLAALQVRIDTAWRVAYGGFFGAIVAVVLLLSPWATQNTSPSDSGAWIGSYRHLFLPTVGLCLCTMIVGGVILTRLMSRARILGGELVPRSNLWLQYEGLSEDPTE